MKALFGDLVSESFLERPFGIGVEGGETEEFITDEDLELEGKALKQANDESKKALKDSLKPKGKKKGKKKPPALPADDSDSDSDSDSGDDELSDEDF